MPVRSDDRGAGDEERLALVAVIWLTASATPEFGTSTITSTLSTSYHWRAMLRADVGLVLVVGGDDLDLHALLRGAEVLDRHARGDHRARRPRGRRRGSTVVQHADLDHVVRDLRLRAPAAHSASADGGDQRAFRSSLRTPPVSYAFATRRDTRAACPCSPRARRSGIMSTTRPCSIDVVAVRDRRAKRKFCSTSRIVKPCSFSCAIVRADLLHDHRREALGRLVEQQQPRAGAQDARRSRASAARRRRAWCPGCAGAPAGSGTARRSARPTARRSRTCGGSSRFSSHVEAREDAALLRAEGDAEARDAVATAGRSSPCPRTRSSPRAGRTMPMIDFSVVVLPAPLRPSSVTTSPLAHVEVDAVQDVRLAVPGVQAAHAQQRARRTVGAQAWPVPR